MLKVRRTDACEGVNHQSSRVSEFGSEMRGDRSHPREIARTSGQEEKAVSPKEGNGQEAMPVEMTWGMFAQAIVGQRVTTPQGDDVMKLALVSFPIPPGVEDRGTDLIEHALGKGEGAIQRVSRRLRRKAIKDGIESFNEEGTLLASFSQSAKNLDPKQLDIFSNLYEAGGMAIDMHHPDKAHENLDYFRKFQNSRQSTLPELIADVKELLSAPEHTMRSAMDDAKFGGAFRQEMILVNGKIMAINIQGELQELSAALGTQEEGHAAWLKWLVDYVNSAYASGARSIVGLQVDSTTTVKSCGGSDEANNFYNNSMVDPYSSAENAYNDWIATAFGLAGNGIANRSSSNGNNGGANSGVGGGGGSQGATGTSHKCTGCGNSVDKDIGVCPLCRTKGHHGTHA